MSRHLVDDTPRLVERAAERHHDLHVCEAHGLGDRLHGAAALTLLRDFAMHGAIDRDALDLLLVTDSLGDARARLTDVGEDAPHKESEIDRVRRHARVAVHEAFTAARRQLEDFAREQRGAVKTHESVS